jgi:hypothetical protein
MRFWEALHSSGLPLRLRVLKISSKLAEQLLRLGSWE